MIVRSYNPYVQINREMLQDTRLSLKARGLAAYIFSLPEGADITVSSVAVHFRVSKKTVMSVLKELEDCGYIVLNGGK